MKNILKKNGKITELSLFLYINKTKKNEQYHYENRI
jgi:hypothetical protein